MSDFFAPKDIESLSKLAALLAVPFFSSALFVDLGFWIVGNNDPAWLHDLVFSSVTWFSFIVKASIFMLSVLVVAFAYHVSNFILHNFSNFMFIFGLATLAFGVLGLGQLNTPTPFGGVNLFWHLGALCWGLHIFSPVGETKAATLK